MDEETVIYPGPNNPELLHLQHQHVSEHVWNEKKDRVLKVRRCRDSRNDKNKLLSNVPPQIMQHLHDAGFLVAAYVKDVPPDHGLLSALVERWRPETHTFHMPFGECTITLQDVALHLGLNINGKPVTGKTDDDWATVVENLLGKQPGDALKGGALKMSWLNNHFKNVEHAQNAEQLACFARAYILRLIGGFLFTDHSGSHVPLRYLLLLEDFKKAGALSWGSAVLANLYREMSQATDYKRVEIGGCTILMQFWAWARIPGIGPQEPNIIRNIPLGGRWNTHPTWHLYPITWYRHRLDTLRANEFVWTPYQDYDINMLPLQCLENRHLWRARVPMICFHIVAWHHPDRVMQQFGMQQHIPQPPLQLKELHDISLTGKYEYDWEAVHSNYIAWWNNRENMICEQNMFQRLACTNDGYMRWYSQRTRRWITRKCASAGQMAEGLGRVHYGLTDEGSQIVSRPELRNEVIQCLALSNEIDRVNVPSVDVPPLELELPQQTADHIPKVGRKEAKGLHRRREDVFPQQFTVSHGPQPQVGQYWTYPSHPAGEFRSYNWGVQNTEFQQEGFEHQTSVTSHQPCVESQPNYHTPQEQQYASVISQQTCVGSQPDYYTPEGLQIPQQQWTPGGASPDLFWAYDAFWGNNSPELQPTHQAMPSQAGPSQAGSSHAAIGIDLNEAFDQEFCVEGTNDQHDQRRHQPGRAVRSKPWRCGT